MRPCVDRRPPSLSRARATTVVRAPRALPILSAARPIGDEEVPCARPDWDWCHTGAGRARERTQTEGRVLWPLWPERASDATYDGTVWRYGVQYCTVLCVRWCRQDRTVPSRTVHRIPGRHTVLYTSVIGCACRLGPEGAVHCDECSARCDMIKFRGNSSAPVGCVCVCALPRTHSRAVHMHTRNRPRPTLHRRAQRWLVSPRRRFDARL